MPHFLLVAALATIAAIARSAQPSAPSPQPAPLRDLPWAQLNFLHTTDTHGWHGGHLQEPSYSADWGDYISFAEHLRAKADRDGVDLLLIDTGDRVEGNGLYDGSDPKGQYTSDIIKQQDIDVICSGNHELYLSNSSNNEYYKTVPNYAGNYLASNLDILNPESGKMEPLAPRYKKFTTKNQGIRILAFGFVYNFQRYANNTFVRPVEDAIQEQWFQDAIRDHDVDLFLVAGHVAVRSEEYDMIYKAIRDVQWDTPIQFFGGHSHIRDFKKYDKKCYAIESGRYMETIGFMSIDGLNTGRKGVEVVQASPSFRRRYIDNNLYSFHYHSSLNESTFPTALGRNVSEQITQARKKLDLDARYGCAPIDLWLYRADFRSNNSVFYWLDNQVLPDTLSMSVQDGRPKLVFSNTGALRFDIFKGPFTRDTNYLISPFTSGFRYIENVDFELASRLLEVINNADDLRSSINPMVTPPLVKWPVTQGGVFDTQNEISLLLHGQHPLNPEETLTPGYVTSDDAGEDGDDTIHSRITSYEIPNCIQTKIDFPNNDSNPKTVDVIYNEFIEPWIILACKFLGQEYSKNDTHPYMEGRSLTDMISDWVGEHWPCDVAAELGIP